MIETTDLKTLAPALKARVMGFIDLMNIRDEGTPVSDAALDLAYEDIQTALRAISRGSAKACADSYGFNGRRHGDAR